MNICTLDYVEQAEEAGRRLRAGEHQHLCGGCNRYFWAAHHEEHRETHGHDPAPSAFDDGVRRKKKKKTNPCGDCEAARAAYITAQKA